MLYFINPGKTVFQRRKLAAKRAVRSRKASAHVLSGTATRAEIDAWVKAGQRRDARQKVARKRRRRTSSVRSRSSHSSRSIMAKRRRRTRRAAAAPRRRRRRVRKNPGGLARARQNPRRRRRRVVARRRRALGNPRRRRRGFRRNPSILPSTRGIVGNVVQGLKDGVAVVGGQVATRKIRGAITGMLPATTQANVTKGIGYVALSLASSIITSLIARKALPNAARMITAGAFSETINCGLAQTPIAPYLSAYPRRRVAPQLRAWPTPPGTLPSQRRVVSSGMAAWPSMRVVGMAPHQG